jgi:mannan endo-1,4-beta-mannosidase
VWFQSFVSGASPVINTGTYGLQRLDYVVESAEAHGISLIINFVNNWVWSIIQQLQEFYNDQLVD